MELAVFRLQEFFRLKPIKDRGLPWILLDVFFIVLLL